jgi:hypothetical protein
MKGTKSRSAVWVHPYFLRTLSLVDLSKSKEKYYENIDKYHTPSEFANGPGTFLAGVFSAALADMCRHPTFDAIEWTSWPGRAQRNY